ncbi:MAG: ATPase [Campylobacterales bacterium]|nr:ATPase [Campylobacterales bacterium]
MLERFYLKDLLSFKEAELEFSKGLIVFTGPSGSGKSVLMESILASLGLGEPRAALCELGVSWRFDEERHGIINESPNILRHLKKEKVRYFINGQSFSRRAVAAIAAEHVKHLSLRDDSDFERGRLLLLLDRFAQALDSDHAGHTQALSETFGAYAKTKKELEALEEEERRVSELKAFAVFEIERIDALKPKIGEDEHLMEVKKALSRREKILSAIANAERIFELESSVGTVLDLLEIDSGFFDDAMNTLRSHLDNGAARMQELEEMDVESILDRLEALAELKRRYGSIEEAIAYRERKRLELERYARIESTKDHLKSEYQALHVRLEQLADTVSAGREKALSAFEARLGFYLRALYLRSATLSLAKVAVDALGQDLLELKIEQTQLSSLSAGEYNRMRLAVLAIWAEGIEHDEGVLLLDEIDANLSGEESMSVARVLRSLSRIYQIFVISHQPQLTSMGTQHFLITREDESRVRMLDEAGRIEEIARMISGDTVTKEARLFAKDLLRSAKE